MEAFLLIPEAEWQQIVSRLERLEKAVQQQAKETEVLPPDEILTVRQAAARLGMTPEGIRKARRAGRLKGVRINEKEWGFYTTELHRYQNRYNRNQYNQMG
ncbi:helix-turn-helix domain-containing protein [Hymenobacter antarcticus]